MESDGWFVVFLAFTFSFQHWLSFILDAMKYCSLFLPDHCPTSSSYIYRLLNFDLLHFVFTFFCAFTSMRDDPPRNLLRFYELFFSV